MLLRLIFQMGGNGTLIGSFGITFDAATTRVVVEHGLVGAVEKIWMQMPGDAAPDLSAWINSEIGIIHIGFYSEVPPLEAY